jgi:transcriptional regulator with XRE-family HTH domain
MTNKAIRSKCVDSSNVETETTKFRAWIKQLREANDWNQGDLARETGFEQSQISKIERGDQLPTERFCIALARVFGLPLEYVLHVGGHLTDEQYRRQLEIRQAATDSPELQRIAAELSTINDLAGLEEYERVIDDIEGLIERAERRAKAARTSGANRKAKTTGSQARRSPAR